MKYTPDEVAKLLANRPNQPHYVKALIGKCVNAAVLAEREACALECDKTYYQHIGDGFGEVRHGIAACGVAIRARGQS